MKDPLQTPRVDAVGVVEYPEDYVASPRSYGRTLRLLSWGVLVLFAAATLLTSALSLGAYCLTSDGGDGRALRDSPVWQQLDKSAEAEAVHEDDGNQRRR